MVLDVDVVLEVVELNELDVVLVLVVVETVELLELELVEVDDVVLVVVGGVEVLDVVEDVVVTGPVKRHEQALETFEASPEHRLAYVGVVGLAPGGANVYVAQNVAALTDDLMKALKQLS